MTKWLIIGLAITTAGLLAAHYAWPETTIINTGAELDALTERRRTVERIREAERRSRNVRGVYMTSEVANDRGQAATKLRNDIIELMDATELNAVVIDVKETRGGLIVTPELAELVRSLREREVWVIARQVVFKDSSQETAHPEWYLKRKATAAGDLKRQAIWRDRKGGSWLDPASEAVWAHQLAAAQAAADAGFDEIQFDYIRFPSDGDLASIVYPVHDGLRPKYEVLRAFFAYLHGELKTYRPDLILSADLFGYAALQAEDLGIGQRLADIGENFDYISLMVYPSHYYSGFFAPADPARNLAAAYYPYRAANIAQAASNRPYDVVYRSLVMARDLLEGRATSTDQNGNAVATSSALSLPPPPPRKVAKLRPWLQDFDLGVDTRRGIHYNAEKVRAQIDAAETAGASGWLLWNPANVYTREALKP